jgi:hypothetical protein
MPSNYIFLVPRYDCPFPPRLDCLFAPPMCLPSERISALAGICNVLQARTTTKICLLRLSSFEFDKDTA